MRHLRQKYTVTKFVPRLFDTALCQTFVIPSLDVFTNASYISTCEFVSEPIRAMMKRWLYFWELICKEIS